MTQKLISKFRTPAVQFQNLRYFQSTSGNLQPTILMLDTCKQSDSTADRCARVKKIRLQELFFLVPTHTKALYKSVF